MDVTITPAAGWVRLEALVTGISAGERCRIVVVGRAGEAGGTSLSGVALVPPEDVTAVRVENLAGDAFVSVPIA